MPALIPTTIVAMKQMAGLAARGKIDFIYQHETSVSPEVIATADLLVFCRNCEPAHHKVLDQVLELQKPYVYELDDNFWEIPLDSAVGRFHRAKKRLNELERFIIHADVVRVYSPRLEKITSQLNSNVQLVNAGFDFSLLPEEPPRRDPDRVRIVYATSRREDPLNKVFLPGLARILDTYPDETEAVFLGTTPADLAGKSNISTEDYVSDYAEYIHRFATAGYDIGLAPLPRTPFFESKTNNKYREYGATRIAGIYSDVSVYSNCVRNGETGLLVNDHPDSWFTALRRLIQEPALRQRIQDHAYEDVYANYRMEVIERGWLESLRSVRHVERPSDEPRVLGGRRSKLFEFRPLEANWCGARITLPDDAKFYVSPRPIELLADSRETIRSSSCRKLSSHVLNLGFSPIRNSEDRLFLARIDASFAELLDKSQIELLYYTRRSSPGARSRVFFKSKQ